MLTAMIAWIAISLGFFAGAFVSSGLNDAKEETVPVGEDRYMVVDLHPSEYVRL